jgi:hypothetical protein
MGTRRLRPVFGWGVDSVGIRFGLVESRMSRVGPGWQSLSLPLPHIHSQDSKGEESNLHT